MKRTIITRKQFLKLQEVFEMYDEVDQVVWHEEYQNGIGPKVTLEFEPKTPIKVDVTDIESW